MPLKNELLRVLKPEPNLQTSDQEQRSCLVPEVSEDSAFICADGRMNWAAPTSTEPQISCCDIKQYYLWTYSLL